MRDYDPTVTTELDPADLFDGVPLDAPAPAALEPLEPFAERPREAPVGDGTTRHVAVARSCRRHPGLALAIGGSIAAAALYWIL